MKSYHIQRYRIGTAVLLVGLYSCNSNFGNAMAPQKTSYLQSTSRQGMTSASSSSPSPLGARNNVQVAPIRPKYSANNSIDHSLLFPSDDLWRAVGLDLARNNVLSVRSEELRSWSETDTARSGVRDYLIDPNRLVYEVTTTFRSDYAIRSNHWSSGTRRFIVDAQTGAVLLSQTVGNMTANAGEMHARLLHSARKPIVWKRITRRTSTMP